MKLINVPIESLEERYSKQWNDNFPITFRNLGLRVVNIYPEIKKNHEIKRGEFLDYVDTNRFKALQIAEICEMFDKGEIGEGDIFFFHDLWFPGLESLFYIRDASGIRFKVAGMLHAGTYDPNDFLAQKGMGRWGTKLEESWFNELDLIFVATKFHKKLLTDRRLIRPHKKIKVTGFPLWDIAAITTSNVQKQNVVVFPHRLAIEKQPHLFDDMANLLQPKLKHHGDWAFIKTKDMAKTKSRYFSILERAKVSVSCALQETWGIAMQESMLRMCIPLVPDRLSYREMYDPLFRYKNPNHMYAKCREFCENYYDIVNSDTFNNNLQKIKHSMATSVTNMVEEMDRVTGRLLR